MKKHIRGWFAVVVMLAVGIGLVGCLGEVDGDDAVFACDDDDDCASGFDCLERPDGQKVCAQEPFDDPEQPDDCEPGANETAEIVDDQCVYECDEGFSDCSDDTAGCESAVEECDQLCDPEENETGSYDVETGECDYDCATGYRDCLDSVDGCESEVASCEYITDDALYVSPDGDDDASGSSLAPLYSLDRAVQIAAFEGYSRIYVAEGTYTSERTIKTAIDLFGGRSPDQDWAQTDEPSVIEDGGGSSLEMPTTLVIDRTDDESEASAEVRGFDIMPPEATEDEPSIATVRVHGVEEEQLLLDDVAIYIGEAGDGADGEHAEEYSDGDGDGIPGEAGEDYDLSWPTQPNPGGAGGEEVDCEFSDDGGEGGGGGDSGDYDDPDGEDGSSGGPDGQGGAGGEGGDGSNDPYAGNDPEEGGDATDGDPGAHGDVAGGDTLSHPAGMFSNSGSRWTVAELEDGQPGEPGKGGGGGGAGGSERDQSGGNTFQAGGTGGGGGSAGCGGAGGESGTSGGSTFGIVVVEATVELGELEIEVKDAMGAGDGGSGGEGACGGEGGSGGSGGAEDGAGTMPAGGDGGDGGDGGNGAPGVGGYGGSTVGVALVGGAQLDDNGDDIDFTIPPEAAGSGGDAGDPASGCPQSDSPEADDGDDGEVFDVLDFD